DTLGGFVARNVQGADAIRVLALDPAIIANDIETSLSKFDAQWNTALTFSRTETPLGLTPAPLDPAQLFDARAAADNVTFNSGLIKPLPTGGVDGITFGLTAQRNHP